MSLKFPINMYDPTRDYKKYEKEYNSIIKKIVSNGRFIGGKPVKDIEKKLADYVGTKHCISVANGTDALQISLMALNVGIGDEVITVAHTWISTSEVISLLGAKPVFIDIEKDTFNMDPKLLEKAITKNTKAILPVSLYGHMCNLEEINKIADKYNLPVIEDGAQSFGSTFFKMNNIPVYSNDDTVSEMKVTPYKSYKSCSLTTIATTSFFPTKPLGCYGDGGVIFTNDDKLAKKIRSIKNHGALKRFHHNYIGVNSRLDTIQAGILSVKIKYFDQSIENRQKCAQMYSQLLKNTKDIILPKVKKNYSHVWAQYSILMKDQKTRDLMKMKLKDNGINVAIFYPQPLHYQKCFQYLDYKKGDLPVTEDICYRIINLPCYGELQEKEIKYICKIFKKNL